MIDNPLFPVTKSNYFMYVGPNREYKNKYFYVKFDSLNYRNPEDFVGGTYRINVTDDLVSRTSWTEIDLILCPEFVSRVPQHTLPEIRKFMWFEPLGMVMVALYVHDGPLYSYVYAYHFDPYERKFANHNGPQHIFAHRLLALSPKYLNQHEAAIYEALLKWED